MRSMAARTSFIVSPGAPEPIETIAGERHAWRFRPHFHAGDEIVQMLAGRARLRLPLTFREVAAGDTVVVPSGTIHRFEPLDGSGWAFRSRFVPRPMNSAAPISAGSSDTFAARATKLLAARPSLHTSVETIAQACMVSAGHLARVFRQETGTSLHNFHVLLALHRVKALLRNRTSIIEAALDAGFYDQAHLNREFVKTFGMTPAVFRAGWAMAT